MKNLLLTLVLACTMVSLNGQAIGIQAGLNFASGTFDDGIDADDIKSISGIRIGPVVQFPLGTLFELHTGAIYSQKGYEILDQAALGTITLDYIEVPIAFAAGFDLGGLGAFVKAGPVLGIGIGGNQSLSIGGQNATETKIEFGNGSGETKLLDTGLTAGAGIKLGTLQIDASYDFSLNDLSNDNAGYKNKVFHIGLSFVIGN